VILGRSRGSSGSLCLVLRLDFRRLLSAAHKEEEQANEGKGSDGTNHNTSNSATPE
jgi:hypothetical protein